MGKGIDLARADAPEHAQMLDDFKDQLLLTLVRLSPGGKLQVPVADVDAAGGYVLLMSVDADKRVFNFEARAKQ